MRIGLFAVIQLQAIQRGKPGWFEIELLFDRPCQTGCQLVYPYIRVPDAITLFLGMTTIPSRM
jgi:hypothetical protein